MALDASVGLVRLVVLTVRDAIRVVGCHNPLLCGTCTAHGLTLTVSVLTSSVVLSAMHLGGASAAVRVRPLLLTLRRPILKSSSFVVRCAVCAALCFGGRRRTPMIVSRDKARQA